MPSAVAPTSCCLQPLLPVLPVPSPTLMLTSPYALITQPTRPSDPSTLLFKLRRPPLRCRFRRQPWIAPRRLQQQLRLRLRRQYNSRRYNSHSSYNSRRFNSSPSYNSRRYNSSPSYNSLRFNNRRPTHSSNNSRRYVSLPSHNSRHRQFSCHHTSTVTSWTRLLSSSISSIKTSTAYVYQPRRGAFYLFERPMTQLIQPTADSNRRMPNCLAATFGPACTSWFLLIFAVATFVNAPRLLAHLSLVFLTLWKYRHTLGIRYPWILSCSYLLQ